MLYFLQLIRWKNLLIIILTQVFVYVFLRENVSFYDVLNARFLLLLLCTFLLASAGYLINDYSDIKIDVINKPDDIIVSRHISPRLALLMHLIFNVAGVAIGFYLNYKLGIINAITAWLLWRYSASFKYKLIIGNIVVAGLMALSLIVVYFPFHNILLQWLVFYSCFAFLTGFAREIIKDVEDMEGDAAYDCRTIPIVYGIFRTKLILTYLMLCMLFLLVFVICYFIYWKTIVYPIYLGIFVLLPMLQVLVLLRKADTRKIFSILSKKMKIIMVLGTLSMALRWFI